MESKLFDIIFTVFIFIPLSDAFLIFFLFLNKIDSQMITGLCVIYIVCVFPPFSFHFRECVCVCECERVLMTSMK